MKKEVLVNHLSQGKTIKKIAEDENLGSTTIRYWMKKYSLSPNFSCVSSRRTWTDDQMLEAIKTSKCKSEILCKLGLKVRPGNYDTLRRYSIKNDIDLSHLDGKKLPLGGCKLIPLEKMLIKDSIVTRQTVKKRILKLKLIPYVCSDCGMGPEWNDKNIVLILDHINGSPDDHRLENLRFLCPNCNSQQKTFCKGKHYRSPTNNCPDCGLQICRTSKKCEKCSHSDDRKVKDRPSRSKLLKEVKESNYCAVGRKYGVSDNAIRKWIK